jgi:hypothetical protein
MTAEGRGLALELPGVIYPVVQVARRAEREREVTEPLVCKRHGFRAASPAGPPGLLAVAPEN